MLLVVAGEDFGSDAGGSIAVEAAAEESAAIAGLAPVEDVETLVLAGLAASGATDGACDEDDGAGISSVLNGVGLSPSGAAPGAGEFTPLWFCMFKSAAGGTATENDGA